MFVHLLDKVLVDLCSIHKLNFVVVSLPKLLEIGPELCIESVLGSDFDFRNQDNSCHDHCCGYKNAFH